MTQSHLPSGSDATVKVRIGFGNLGGYSSPCGAAVQNIIFANFAKALAEKT